MLLDGAVHGMVQYGEEDEPDYRHASSDIFLDPATSGRCLGRDAVDSMVKKKNRFRVRVSGVAKRPLVSREVPQVWMPSPARTASPVSANHPRAHAGPVIT